MNDPVGKKTWMIPEGYISYGQHGNDTGSHSEKRLCLYNRNGQPAHCKVMIYFADKEPLGPYRIDIPGKRNRYVRFYKFKNPLPIPRETEFSSVIESDLPVELQYTP